MICELRSTLHDSMGLSVHNCTVVSVLDHILSYCVILCFITTFIVHCACAVMVLCNYGAPYCDILHHELLTS